MIVIVNEKPSQARNMAKALGGMQGTYNGQQYRIAHLLGHLYEYKKPADQVPESKRSRYSTWDLSGLPWDVNDIAWKRSPRGKTSDVIRALKMACSGADEIVVATDWDSSGEGDLLFWEAIEECHITANKFSRMHFDDESEKELRRAFDARVVIPDHLRDANYMKATYRSKFDWLSMQWSRVATLTGDGHTLLRQGRLKSAIVVLVGDQFEKIKGYKKIPFYQNRFRDEHNVQYVDETQTQYANAEDVPDILHISPVVVDEKTIKHTAPPRLLNLAGLSARLASAGLKTKQILSVYQKMYESQVVSYPRTDDKVVTSAQFDEFVQIAPRVAKLVGVDSNLLTHTAPRSSHVHDKGVSHGANRPASNVPATLDELDAKYGRGASLIYKELALSALAMLAEDYEYEHQKGHVSEYPTFVGSVNVPRKAGWRAVFDTGDVDAEECSLGLGTTAKPFVYEGFPPKPQAPTLKWLVSRLEAHEVGTGATRANCIGEISESRDTPLLKITRGKITMTPAGDMSYALLQGTHIGSLKLTEQVMADMEAIAEGEMSATSKLAEVAQLVREDIVIMQENGANMRKTKGIKMEEQQAERFEGIWAKTGQKVHPKRVWRGHRFTDEEVEKLLAGEVIELHNLTSKAGNAYGVRGALAEQEYNGNSFVGFESQGFVDTVPNEICKHVFTPEEKAALTRGESVYVEGMISKQGKPFSSHLTWEPDENDPSRKRINFSFEG